MIWQDSNYSTPTETYCNNFRSQAGLTAPTVLFDHTGSALSAVGLDDMHWHFVLEKGAKVHHQSKGTDALWRPAIDEVLGGP